MVAFFKKSIIAAGAEGIHGKDALLDNDDLRPLKLADRYETCSITHPPN
jgi:hypothetical protein